MALTPEQMKILEARLRSNSSTATGGVIPMGNEGGQSGIAGFAAGAGKQFIKSTLDTTELLQKGGQMAIAAVTPNQTYEDVKAKSGFDFLDSNTSGGQDIRQMVTPTGSTEKAGGAAEIAAEFLLPVLSSTKVMNAGKTFAKNASDLVKSPIQPVNLIKETIQDVITPLEKGVESVLNPTTLIPKEVLKNLSMENLIAQSVDKGKKLELYLKQAQKAVNDFSQPTPLEIAGKRAEQALNVLNNKLAKQGQLKQEALGIIGDKVVKNIGSFREKLAQTISERVGINIDRVTGDIIEAKGRKSKIALDPKDNEMLKMVYRQLQTLGRESTVRQVDDVVDSIQDVLYKRKQNLAETVNTIVEGALKETIGLLNTSLKKVGGEQYRKANDKFSYFIDVRDNLNKALGLDANKAGALMKRVFSPSDGGTKKLFGKIKELTGIDLIEDATLAKFVMENVGDARQASLLEEIIKGRVSGPTSFVEKAVEKTIGKLQDPIEKARRTVQNFSK